MTMYRDSIKRCYDCDDHAAKMDSARDYFEGVLNELFSMDNIHVIKLMAIQNFW